MRITGGQYGGRILKAPAGDAVRPTQDRVREALFSILQNDIADRTFLDMFAGTGGVGLEALSRGAARTTFVEAAPRHAAFIEANVEMLKVAPQTELIRADVYKWLESSGAAERNFDIAFADPPYDLGMERGYASMLRTLAERNVVKRGGLFIAEMKAFQKPDEDAEWDLCRDRTYGKSRILVWKRHA